jgi:PAS domain S-box-containing protein
MTDLSAVLLDRVPQGVLTVSREGGVTYANRAMAAMTGVPHAALAGMPFLALAAGPHRSRLRAALAAAREAPTHRRCALARSDGSELAVLFSFAPLSKGQVSCLVTDLTERKRREDSAHRASRFLATLAHEFRDALRPMQRSLGQLALARSADEDALRAVASMLRETDRLLALVEDLRNINS